MPWYRTGKEGEARQGKARKGKGERQENEREWTNERNTGQTMPFQMGYFKSSLYFRKPQAVGC